MQDNQNTASDTAAHGRPRRGTVAAGRSAEELEDGDAATEDAANLPRLRPRAAEATPGSERHPLIEMRGYNVLVPFQGPKPCPACADQNRTFAFLKPMELQKHVDEQHHETKITWECICTKQFDRARGWISHQFHCQGPTEPEEPKEFQCEACQASFATRMGLSIHEMHLHPNVRNRKRTEEAKAPPKKKGAPRSVWSEDELEELMKRCVQYEGEYYINAKIAQHIMSKTNKQISDKRCETGFQADLRKWIEEHVEESDSENEETESEEPEEESEGEAEEESDTSCSTIIDTTQQSESLEELGLGEDVPESAGNGTESESEDEFSDAMEELPEEVAPDAQVWNSWQQAIVNYVNNSVQNEIGYKAEDWVIKAQQKMNDRDITNDDIEVLYDELVSIIDSNKEPRHPNKKKRNGNTNWTNHRRNRGRNIGPPSRSEIRRYEYARCQDLYNNEPKKLAHIVAENDLSLLKRHKPPEKEAVNALYNELWGREGPQNLQEEYRKEEEEISIDRILTPITAREVRIKLTNIDSTSAAGPDGLKRNDVKGYEQALATLFNLLFINKYYLSKWKTNRTTLIPKAGKDPKEVKNWRPITISSIISRVFSAMLDRRLRRVIDQSKRQKGFTEENGCYENVKTLGEVIAEAKKSGAVIDVKDLAKAFDTIPHAALSPALQRKGIPDSIANYIADMFKECKTKIRADGGDVEIELKRGVKQGDPLSPLMFNVAIEPGLDAIQRNTKGVKIGGRNLSVMAFADDVVTVAKDVDTAKIQVLQFAYFLQKLGMTLAVEKCKIFQITPRGKAWYIEDPQIEVNGEKIPAAEPNEIITYLGAKLMPWKGLIKGFERELLEQLIRRVKTLPLKPLQKVDLFSQYLLPKIVYGLIVNAPSRTELRRVDDMVRGEVKRILHICESTNNAFLYAPKKKGGLGLLEIEKMVLIASIRNAVKASQSEDPVVRAVFQTEKIQNKMEEYTAALGAEWPLTLRELDKIKADTKNGYIEEWASKGTQGKGVRDFSEPVSNMWISQKGMLQHSRIADAIKMRTNTYPTRVTLKNSMFRNVPTYDISCRKCKEKPETLGHILGECIHTKPKRISRHDEIKDLLCDRLSKDNCVLREQSFWTGEETLRPDLVVKLNDGKARVIDVTVRFESGDSLKEAAQEKIDKYKRLEQVIKEELQVTKVEVIPIVVGVRGAIPKSTHTELKKLRISKGDCVTISMIALRSSLEMANAFMDYD